MCQSKWSCQFSQWCGYSSIPANENISQIQFPGMFSRLAFESRWIWWNSNHSKEVRFSQPETRLLCWVTIVMSQIEIVTNQRSKKFFEPKMLEIKPNWFKSKRNTLDFWNVEVLTKVLRSSRKKCERKNIWFLRFSTRRWSSLCGSVTEPLGKCQS